MLRRQIPLAIRAAWCRVLWLAAGLVPVPAAAQVGAFLGFGWYDLPAPHAGAPPPVYYAVPPPAYAYPSYGYLPPPGPATPLTLSCRAGAWTCPLGQPASAGDPCSCPTPNGPAWGRVGG
jgi:hypothetical protein